MNQFQSVSPESVDPVFRKIGKDWMLISASDGKTANTMTASWGGLGVLWNKQIAVCFIRPERFTYPIVEEATHLSLSFLPEQYRAALSFCGSHSGRDGNKFEAAGLTKLETENGVPYPAEAELVLICRKLYADDLNAESFLDKAPLEKFYGASGGLHRFYVCEIEKVLQSN